MSSEFFDEFFRMSPLNYSFISEVLLCYRQNLKFVNIKDLINWGLSNIKNRQRWQKVVSNKETKENDIINYSFKVELKVELDLMLFSCQRFESLLKFYLDVLS